MQEVKEHRKFEKYLKNHSPFNWDRETEILILKNENAFLNGRFETSTIGIK